MLSIRSWWWMVQWDQGNDIMMCSCNKSGYCSRYNLDMTDRMFYLCKHSNSHRQLFERVSVTQQGSLADHPKHNKLKMFLWSVYHIVASGFSIAKKQKVLQRREICRNCSQNRKGVCQSCGCIILLKTLFCSSFCPDLKWGIERHSIWGKPVISIGANDEEIISNHGCGCGSKATKPSPTLPILPGVPGE